MSARPKVLRSRAKGAGRKAALKKNRPVIRVTDPGRYERIQVAHSYGVDAAASN